jgi:hypothetical protein
MSIYAHRKDLQIDSIHDGAACQEIGEQLGRAFVQSNELSPRLLSLIAELAKGNLTEGPRKYDGI